MLLSDDEISGLSLSAVTVKDALSDVREIEAAILARLGAMELPEPVAARWPSVPGSHHYAGAGGCGHGAFGEESEDLFTADQLTAWGNTRYAQGAAAQLSSEPVGFIDKCGEIFAQVEQILSTDTPLYTRREAK